MYYMYFVFCDYTILNKVRGILSNCPAFLNTSFLKWKKSLEQVHNWSLYGSKKIILVFTIMLSVFLWFIMVIEQSGVQFGLKSYAWFQNRTSMQCELNLKSQVWFQTKIAQHEVQLPLYYIHFEIAQIQDLVSSNILLMQYWAGLKLNSSIFGGEKVRVWKQKLQNLPHDTLCLSFSCNLIGYFKQASKSDGLFCF